MATPERPRFESTIRTPFPELAFHGTLRPSQREVIEMASAKLTSGADRRLHIVAPPGAGKTVLGLYLWAQVVKRPAVVLSPNSAIQAQWAARIDLFQDRSRIPLSDLDVHFVNSLPLLEVARVLKPFIFKGSKLAQDL